MPKKWEENWSDVNLMSYQSLKENKRYSQLKTNLITKNLTASFRNPSWVNKKTNSQRIF